jgi:hypothetical protein
MRIRRLAPLLLICACAAPGGEALDDARAARERGDHAAARTKAAAAIDEPLDPGRSEVPERIALLSDAGSLAHDLGDLTSAGKARRLIPDVRARTLPGDHLDLQKARKELAVTIKDLGDVQGARAKASPACRRRCTWPALGR